MRKRGPKRKAKRESSSSFSSEGEDLDLELSENVESTPPARMTRGNLAAEPPTQGTPANTGGNPGTGPVAGPSNSDTRLRLKGGTASCIGKQDFCF